MSQFLYHHLFHHKGSILIKCTKILHGLHSQRSPFDIMCNYDIMDSPLLENMVSLERLLKLNKESRHERKVNFLH